MIKEDEFKFLKMVVETSTTSKPYERVDYLTVSLHRGRQESYYEEQLAAFKQIGWNLIATTISDTHIIATFYR